MVYGDFPDIEHRTEGTDVFSVTMPAGSLYANDGVNLFTTKDIHFRFATFNEAADKIGEASGNARSMKESLSRTFSPNRYGSSHIKNSPLVKLLCDRKTLSQLSEITNNPAASDVLESQYSKIPVNKVIESAKRSGEILSDYRENRFKTYVLEVFSRRILDCAYNVIIDHALTKGEDLHVAEAMNIVIGSEEYDLIQTEMTSVMDAAWKDSRQGFGLSYVGIGASGVNPSTHFQHESTLPQNLTAAKKRALEKVLPRIKLPTKRNIVHTVEDIESWVVDGRGFFDKEKAEEYHHQLKEDHHFSILRVAKSLGLTSVSSIEKNPSAKFIVEHYDTEEIRDVFRDLKKKDGVIWSNELYSSLGTKIAYDTKADIQKLIAQRLAEAIHKVYLNNTAQDDEQESEFVLPLEIAAAMSDTEPIQEELSDILNWIFKMKPFFIEREKTMSKMEYRLQLDGEIDPFRKGLKSTEQEEN